MGPIDLSGAAKQTVFAQLVGVSQQAINARVSSGQLSRGGTYQEWLIEYVDDLRTQAAGRVHDNDKTLADQRLRESEQKTLQLAIANSKELGSLLLAHEAVESINIVFSEVASEINNAGTVIQERLESELATRIDDELIFKPLGDAAGRIAKAAREFGEGLEAGSGEIDSTLAAIHG